MAKQNNDEMRISLLMPETYNPLSKTSKILLSVFILVMIIGYVYIYIIEKTQLFFVVFWSLYGVIGLYKIYTGKNFLTLFGDAYFIFNHDYIKYKPHIFKKEKIFLWKDITKVSLKAGYLLFENNKSDILKLSFNNMQYEKVQKVKKSIEQILKEKGIEYN